MAMAHHEVVYNYVEDVDPNLVCSICQSALVNPVTTASCKHTFCRDCITRALAHSPTCPIDRSALTLSSLVDTEPLVQLMLDELKVRCEAPGCAKTMERGLLLAHLRTCSQAIVTCGDKECGLSMARHRLPHHRAYECFHRRMDCHGCGVAVTFREAKDKDIHGCVPQASQTDKMTTMAHVHRWVCTKAPVPCTQSSRGCTAIVPRDELESHLKTCPFEALSSFFKVNDARFATLERRQEELSAENEGLRAQLWSLRRTQIVPRSLRDGLDEPLLPTAQEPSLTAPRSASRHESPSSPSPSATRMDPPPPIPVIYPAVATIASTSDPLSPTREQVLHIPQSFLSPPPRLSYTDWVLGRLLPPSAYSDGCAALRAAVIHLAAGLDASERRNEVRIVTETLRVQEEVATLRAIVSPMRMQVLADRPNSPAISRFPSFNAHVHTTHTPAQDLPTPPLSTSHSGPASEVQSDTEEDHDRSNRASIRESVVFSAQDVYPRSSSASFVSTASATPPPTRWTGRPLAFPPPGPASGDSQPRSPTRRLRIGSVGSQGGFIGSSLGSTLASSSLGATILRRRESSRH
ncbi:uncharacterized protein CcaverHIS019_0601810 [Cutaneotrichosporon cavernicola]|uniref:RING-type domain-containing protein n=1 Tax=Cutaneotrichosporon cavernicola TaxID=279322 RepID=A0AA48QXT8_9TREE|nr:uncharacterized protein CcaverHIS019_0601810 [Cutaneotrichosporon cavernicola]BEI93722.1 hypothetical protein CcaverHIS019_0601810 [Cutaneotrichosporon cavernicola]